MLLFKDVYGIRFDFSDVVFKIIFRVWTSVYPRQIRICDIADSHGTWGFEKEAEGSMAKLCIYWKGAFLEKKKNSYGKT